LKHIYQIIDDVWSMISKIVFVRFQFEIPVEELREAQRNGKIIFAITNGGIFEWLILSSWCRSKGLGPILVGNRKTILALSKPSWFFRCLLGKAKYAEYFLINEKGPGIVFCPPNERKELFKPTPVETLLSELSASSMAERKMQFYIIPVLILWRKYLRGERRRIHELLLGSSSNPNWLGKLWYLFRKRQDSSVKSLGMIPLVDSERLTGMDRSDAIDETEGLKNARIIRRKIIVSIQQEMRVILGPRYLPPTAVKETLMRDEAVQKLIRDNAQIGGADTKKQMMLAYQYLTEIVANYTYRFVELMEIFLGWLFNRVFEGLVTNRDDIARVRELMKTKPIVFVSCHRSHLDYLVVPYVLFTEDMVTPHIAAGINLSFWPVGYFLRQGGAFFIRRSFRGNELYSLLLKKYVEFLLMNKHNIKFFIEGTRSRSGKMLPPAYGLLKMILESYRSNSLDDIALVPVSICYEQVFEEGAYSKELQGGSKQKESASGLIQSRKILKGKYGKVYVRFAEPFFVKEIIQKEQQENVDPKLTLQKTAFKLCKRINDVSPITPKAILSSILLAHPEPALPLVDILRISERMADYVTHSNMVLTTPQRSSFRAVVESTIRTLQKKSVIQVTESTPRAYNVDQRKRVGLNYYKNNAIHCFVLPSISVMAFLDTVKSRGEIIKLNRTFYQDFLESALTLRDILKFEFFFSPRERFTEEIQGTLSFFSESCPWETATDDQFIAGFKNHFINWDEASVYAGLLGELLESYASTMSFLKENPGEIYDKKQFIARLIQYSEELSERGQIQYPESISVQNFSNDILSCENYGYVGTEKGEERDLLRVLPWNFDAEETLKKVLRYLELLKENPAKILN